MSRYKDWNRAFEGISNHIRCNGITVNKHNFKIEMGILNSYCKDNNINGSFSERVLKVSSEFNLFKEWIKHYIKL